MTRTVARNAHRKIAAIRAEYTEARRYDSATSEMVPCEAAAAWEALATPSARLIADDTAEVYTVRVHSNSWFELRKPVPQDVADAAAKAAAEAERLAALRLSVFGDTSHDAARVFDSVADNCDETTADTGRVFTNTERWRLAGEYAETALPEDLTPAELVAAHAAVGALSAADLDDYDHRRATAADLLARFEARLADTAPAAAAPGAPAAEEETDWDEEEPVPAEVLAARPGELVVVPDTVHPSQYNVWMGREHVGVVFDETHARLSRPPLAAWSGKLPKNLFLATLDEAADAIAEANLPAGPLGLAAPKHWLQAMSFRSLPVRRRARVLARAAEICGTGRAHARAFQAAMQEDWTEYLASQPVPDESEFGHCIALGGGEIHTYDRSLDHGLVHPMCRTMDQNNRLTRYRTTQAAAPTCRHCISYRDHRAERRAEQAGRVQPEITA
ncbi:hypothetical protein ACFV1L_21815 [Kitasatospora sp. NPDC059646]|uniref:hypothetical protein n=1 Tax=Kitasatospora sp. NPDC059646 TaxID=3346893 RepID=UPI0036A3FA1C